MCNDIYAIEIERNIKIYNKNQCCHYGIGPSFHTKFQSYNNIHTNKYIWKCCLQNGIHFVLVTLCTSKIYMPDFKIDHLMCTQHYRFNCHIVVMETYHFYLRYSKHVMVLWGTECGMQTRCILWLPNAMTLYITEQSVATMAGSGLPWGRMILTLYMLNIFRWNKNLYLHFM